MVGGRGGPLVSRAVTGSSDDTLVWPVVILWTRSTSVLEMALRGSESVGEDPPGGMLSLSKSTRGGEGSPVGISGRAAKWVGPPVQRPWGRSVPGVCEEWCCCLGGQRGANGDKRGSW